MGGSTVCVPLRSAPYGEFAAPVDDIAPGGVSAAAVRCGGSPSSLHQVVQERSVHADRGESHHGVCVQFLSQDNLTFILWVPWKYNNKMLNPKQQLPHTAADK